MTDATPRPYRITSRGRTYRFATEDEAVTAANDYYARTGFLVGIERDAAARCTLHRMGPNDTCTACGMSAADAHTRGHSISGYDALYA